jgi:glucose-6-phosphate 1-dehydrogenase
MPTTPDPAMFVIFGATGDLSRRKLLPALASAYRRGELDGQHHVVGLSSDTTLTEAKFRELCRAALAKAKVADDLAATICNERLHFQTIGKGTPEDYRALKARLHALSETLGLPQNYAFYLALPPAVMPRTVAGLDAAGLSQSNGWVRLVIEKPFGHDLASAQELNAILHKHFKEEQIYRIDHYLGKETVQNLLVFRFANPIFEALWNRERIQSVEITVAEELGVEQRAGYYDTSGALRDMVQNHLTQLLTLVAMEIPSAFAADAIRYEKIKVLRSIAPIDLSRVVRGQYAAGELDGAKVKSYLEEEDVPEGSTTETFVAMQLDIDNWRWQGVPFYLRTGKRLKQRSTQIVVRFRDAPVSLFKAAGVKMDMADMLLITLQPDEGFSLHFDVKAPGEPFTLKRIPLSFRYNDVFEEMPDSYETLLLDVLYGDQTLFVHGDEAEESWRLYKPVLENPPPPTPYAPGSWGPDAAAEFAIPQPTMYPAAHSVGSR